MTAPLHCQGSAFGLTIASNVAIPGLALARVQSPVDVRVHLDEAQWASLRGASAGTRWYESPERDGGVPWLTVWKGEAFTFDYAEGAVFVVSGDGTRVQAAWRAPLTVHDVATFLLGPVLAFVLRLRGTVPLHASAVVIGGQAVLFVGPAGAGKSSTAAALGVLGHPVLSDDVVPMGLGPSGFVAYPGYPRLNIWEDSSRAIFGIDAALPRVSAVYGKHVVDLQERGIAACGDPTTVDTIYVLGDRTGSGSVQGLPLTPREGVVALAANTYGAYLLDRDLRAREFEFLCGVAHRARLQSLCFEGGLERLVAQCGAIADARGRTRAREGCGSRTPVSS